MAALRFVGLGGQHLQVGDTEQALKLGAHLELTEPLKHIDELPCSAARTFISSANLPRNVAALRCTAT
ncbi:hypothetical protein BG57_28395 [Caballeronia grimmiae]|uniref:Uncharacterized protein n=1 Tax=Caballeronia grimmiae TaxID=1071679 RepID=A0A069NCV3_9BURK|nr:hypothetical protein BG57_28395 [Caballeronia grimmiae]